MTANDESEHAYSNIDELLKAMALDEIEDAPLITPVNYAKTVPRLSPQIIYYHIRAGHLATVLCPCGRKCIKKEEADEFFRPKGEAE